MFVRIWEARDEIDPENSLKSYVFKTVQNLSINKLRRKKVESKYIEIFQLVYVDNHEFSAQESLQGRELEAHIIRSIKKLPGECRKIFELSRSEGLKYKEIAETLNISVKTCRSANVKSFEIAQDRTDRLYFTLMLICH